MVEKTTFAHFWHFVTVTELCVTAGTPRFHWGFLAVLQKSGRRKNEPKLTSLCFQNSQNWQLSPIFGTVRQIKKVLWWRYEAPDSTDIFWKTVPQTTSRSSW